MDDIPAEGREPQVTCVVCSTEFRIWDSAPPVCRNGHSWCIECINEAVRTAIDNVSDDSCMPPRCCGDALLSLFAYGGGPVAPLLDDGLFYQWEEARQQAQALRYEGEAEVDLSVVRMAKRVRGTELYQFCPRCKRLMARSKGCNHIRCICQHEFCLICGGDWGQNELCHPFFGAEDQHVLNIPPEIQARLDEEDRQPPPAYLDDEATGLLCEHRPEQLYKLRLRRELGGGDSGQSRCHVCGKLFREFLLECKGCRTLMCLDCRDEVWYAWRQTGED